MRCGQFFILNILICCRDKYVPTQCCSGSRVTAQWMNTSVLGAIWRKRKAWHKFQATSRALDYNEYCRCRNVTVNLM